MLVSTEFLQAKLSFLSLKSCVSIQGYDGGENTVLICRRFMVWLEGGPMTGCFNTRSGALRGGSVQPDPGGSVHGKDSQKRWHLSQCLRIVESAKRSDVGER